jgi:outer membrane protein assembly factor BamB
VTAFCLLVFPLLSSCGSNTTPTSSQQPGLSNIRAAQPFEAGPYNCKGNVHVASNTSASPVPAPRSIYFGGDRGNLYAVNAQTGNLRWCVHLDNPGAQATTPPCPGHCPSFPSFLIVGTPAVVDGVVYVCGSGAGETGYTYAVNAGDGSLRWRTQSDCWVVSIPFGDYAIPLVSNGVVYSGLTALRARDGQVLWKETHINLTQDGELILLAVADGVVYACTEAAVYALNAADGSIRWRYPPHTYMTVGGPLVVSVSNQTLIVGTQGSVDQPETSAVYAINTENGALRWYHLMGDYIGATFLNNVAYVSSGDRYLYAFNAINGKMLWRSQLGYTAWYAPFMAKGILYSNADGAYAVDSANGRILWHKSLGADQSVSFDPSVVIDGTDFLSSTDGHGVSTLYVLNAGNGAEYWHSAGINQISPLAVA